jgi:DNA-binding transcriptional ArsR family regulator
MEDIFLNLSEYLKRHNQKAIIAIDEFQQIATIKDQNIEATLRKYIQNLDNISFVYSGSKRHMLTQMFTDHKKAFYNQAIPLELKPISKDSFFNFIEKKFLDTDRSISKEAFSLLYDTVDGESWLVQNLSYHLWQENKDIQSSMILEKLNDIVSMSDSIFKILYDSFSNTQKTALKTIIKQNGQNLLSKEVLAMENISKSSLSSGLKVLYEKEIIDKNNNLYYINDKLFEVWLKSIFSMKPTTILI